MKRSDKRGLSAIVVMMMIILLAIVAFGIVSVVVKQTVTKGAESIELANKCIEIDIKATKVTEVESGSEPDPVSYSYIVTISRTAVGDPIDGIDLIFDDIAGENSVSKERDGVIKPLEKFTDDAIELGEFRAGKVTVVPYFTKKTGEKYSCGNPQTFEIPQPN